MKSYGYYNLITQNGFIIEIPNNDSPELKSLSHKRL